MLVLLTTPYASQYILKEQDERSSALGFRQKYCSLFMELLRVQKWSEKPEAVARNQQLCQTVIAFLGLIFFFCKKRTGIMV